MRDRARIKHFMSPVSIRKGDVQKPTSSPLGFKLIR
jgi:hypothetical protein